VEGRLKVPEDPTPHPGGQGLSVDVIAAEAEMGVTGAFIEMQDQKHPKKLSTGASAYLVL
jgi:hypothetical protein